MNTCEKCRGVWAVSVCLIVAMAILCVTLAMSVQLQAEDMNAREKEISEKEADQLRHELNRLGQLDNRLLRADVYLRIIEDTLRRAQRASTNGVVPEIDKKRGKR